MLLLPALPARIVSFGRGSDGFRLWSGVLEEHLLKRRRAGLKECFGSCLERRTVGGESPVRLALLACVDTRVLRDTRNLVGIWGDHPPRLNTRRHR